MVLAFIGGALGSIPASMAACWLSASTHGRVLLTNTEGTLWQGSAQWALKSPESAAVLLPGRLSWQIVPALAGLNLKVGLPSPGGDAQPVQVTFAPFSGYVTAGQVRLPARILNGLGAPFNTLGLEGELMVEWPASRWTYSPLAPATQVSSKIELRGISARVSPVAPMGSYQLGLQWGPSGGSFELTTLSGALILTGHGDFKPGRAFRFDGQAQAEAQMQGQLGGLLSILGQQEGGITRLHY